MKIITNWRFEPYDSIYGNDIIHSSNEKDGSHLLATIENGSEQFAATVWYGVGGHFIWNVAWRYRIAPGYYFDSRRTKTLNEAKLQAEEDLISKHNYIKLNNNLKNLI